jgi:ATP synthase protein I
MGLAVVIAIFLGLGLGMLLDKHLGTKPWCMVAGLLLGVAAGFRNLVVMANRVEKGEKQIEQELNRSLQRVGVSPGYPADEPKTDRANGPSEKAGDTGDEKG